MKFYGVYSIHLGLDFGGQECLRHNFFSLDSTMELLKCTGINDHLINLAFQVALLLVAAPIFPICRNNNSFPLWVWGLNTLTKKNWYPLFLIKALPSWSKCQFWQEKVSFLGYVVFSHVVLIFRCSSNFHQRFIQGFNRIAAPLTSMLKTTGSSRLLAPKAFRTENNEVVRGGSRADETVVDPFNLVKKLSKVEKPQKPEKFIKIIGLEKSSLLTSNTELVIIKNYRPLLNLLRFRSSTNCKLKVLIVTNYISDGLEIQKTRASVRFAGLKSFFNTIFALIFDKAKLMELRILRRVFS